jgi:hypothetical protein
MKFTLEIDLDNDAFMSSEDDARNGDALADILKELSEAFRYLDAQNGYSGNLRDVNGNPCGHWQIV